MTGRCLCPRDYTRHTLSTLFIWPWIAQINTHYRLQPEVNIVDIVPYRISSVNINISLGVTGIELDRHSFCWSNLHCLHSQRERQVSVVNRLSCDRHGEGMRRRIGALVGTWSIVQRCNGEGNNCLCASGNPAERVFGLISASVRRSLATGAIARLWWKGR